jgi:hypothetical protein
MIESSVEKKCSSLKLSSRGFVRVVTPKQEKGLLRKDLSELLRRNVLHVARGCAGRGAADAATAASSFRVGATDACFVGVVIVIVVVSRRFGLLGLLGCLEGRGLGGFVQADSFKKLALPPGVVAAAIESRSVRPVPPSAAAARALSDALSKADALASSAADRSASAGVVRDPACVFFGLYVFGIGGTARSPIAVSSALTAPASWSMSPSAAELTELTTAAVNDGGGGGGGGGSSRLGDCFRCSLFLSRC